jgi:hypothetical protein
MSPRAFIFGAVVAFAVSLPLGQKDSEAVRETTGEDVTYSGSSKSPVQVIYWDFDDDDGNFTGGGAGSWVWGPPSTPPLATVNQAWETGGLDNYPDFDCSWLDSPAFFIEDPHAMLIFTQHLSIQQFADGGNVQISLDGGATFQLILPRQGYPYPPPPDVMCPEGLQGPVFSGFSGAYGRGVFPLGQFAGQYAILRWVFESDGAVNYQGWIIDDVRIFGARL